MKDIPAYPRAISYPHAVPIHRSLHVSRPEGERLVQLCKRLAEEETARCRAAYGGTHAFVCTEAERVLREFGVAVEQLVLSNAIEAAPDTPEEALAGIVKARIATLKDTRQRFAKEEQEWRELAARRDDDAAPSSPTTSQQRRAMEEAAAAAAAAVASESAAGALPEAQARAHATLALQVDRICAMVSGCEALVASAEERAGQLASRFHRESFRMLPHVDSPAVLIKSLQRGRAADA